MASIKTEGEFYTDEQQCIRYSYFSSAKQKGPVIILVHGFKGFKDWGFFPVAADRFASAGYPAFTFNFSHNGIGADNMNFTEEDKFAANTYSREVSELGEVLSWLTKTIPEKYAEKGVYLLGHSRGGVSVIKNAVHPAVRGIVLWASICKVNRFSARQAAEWRDKGSTVILNSRTGQVLKINTSLLDDIENNQKTSLNLETSLKSLEKPVLILHGEEDLAVPITEAKSLAAWAGPDNAEFISLPHCGHTFGIVHPFTGTTQQFEKVLENTLSFFNKFNN